MSSEAPKDPEPEPSGEGTQAEALDAVVARLAELVTGLQRLIDVQVARARVEFREKSFRALGWLLTSALLLVVAATAGVYILRGLSGLLTGALGNVSWAGDLAAGAAGLLVVLVSGLLVRARLRRRNLRLMRDKFPEA